MTLAEQSGIFFAKSADKEMLAFAADNWPSDLSRLTGDHAEVARFARLAAYRSRPSDVQIWQARAVAAGAVSGNLRSLALSMMTDFWVLTAQGRASEAREVLDVTEQVANASTMPGSPTTDLVDRIVAERRAYSFRVEERWAEALSWYRKAAALAPAGSRDAAKVAGGAAVAHWLAGAANSEAADTFAALVETASEWPDVRDAAEANHAAAARGDRASAVPFDLT